MKLVPMSKEDIAARAQELASRIHEVARLEEEKKISTREYTDVMKEKRAEIARLSEAVSTGKEWRDDKSGKGPTDSAA